MISRLKTKISVLILVLVGVIYIGGLVIFNWMNFRDNLDALRDSILVEMREAKWSNVFSGDDSGVELEDVPYCVLSMGEDGRAEVLINHFSQMEEEELLAYGERISNRSEMPGNFFLLAYVVRWYKHEKYIVIFSNEPAVRASLPVIGFSVLAVVVGILALFLVSRTLSRWLVRPVEDMLMSEKQFLSNASHELKTPLAVIGANAELLEGEIGENKQLQYIRQEAGRMTVLVNRMLELVRLDSPAQGESFQRFRADTALLDVIYPMESVAYEKKLALSIDVQDNMYLTGSEEQLKSLVSILMDNAISYTPEQGSISVRAYLHSHRFYLKVANSGEEIPAKVRERLFERFYRQDDARTEENHFGLGLSIAKGIVDNHHGELRVESKDGKNCFTAILPAAGKS